MHVCVFSVFLWLYFVRNDSTRPCIIFSIYSTIFLFNFFITLPSLKADYLDLHDDVIKWKHIPRYWPFVRRIHRSPVNSPHKGQWHGALMFSLICVWLKGWVSNHGAGDLRRYRAHYDVIVMIYHILLELLLWHLANFYDCFSTSEATLEAASHENS